MPTGPVHRRGVLVVLVALAGTTSAAATVGTVMLATGTATPPLGDLEPLHLDSWRLPALWLALSVALPCAVAATAAARRLPSSGSWATAAGLLLAVELVVQVPFVGLDPLQAVMATVASTLVALGRRARPRAR